MTPRPRLLPFPHSFLTAALLCALALLSSAPAAHAAPPEDDPPARAARLDPLDPPLPEDSPSPTPGALEIAIEAGVARHADGDRAFQAMLLASIPLERLTRPATPRRPAPPPRPRLRSPDTPPPLPSISEEAASPRAPASPAPAPPPAAPDAPEPPAPPSLPVRITPELARAAVAAALRRAGLADPEARLDALASRARAAALLPELRLRVARELDEAQTLAPTEYDPARTTATGGASLWLEARAAWRLDRLLFADEELTLERIRRERAEAQRRLVDRVLALLFTWQRARAHESDPDRTSEERLTATLDAIEAEATLDILTGGWFTHRTAPP